MRFKHKKILFYSKLLLSGASVSIKESVQERLAEYFQNRLYSDKETGNDKDKSEKVCKN